MTLAKAKAPTQKERVLELLQNYGSEGVSALEMLRFGIYRAAARISELREEGWTIHTINEHGKTAVYVLKGKQVSTEPLVPVGGQPSLWEDFERGGQS